MTARNPDRARERELMRLGAAIATAARTPAPNTLDCELCEERIVELAPDPEEVAELIWYVIDCLDKSPEELRDARLWFENP